MGALSSSAAPLLGFFSSLIHEPLVVPLALGM